MDVWDKVGFTFIPDILLTLETKYISFQSKLSEIIQKHTNFWVVFLTSQVQNFFSQINLYICQSSSIASPSYLSSSGFGWVFDWLGFKVNSFYKEFNVKKTISN